MYLSLVYLDVVPYKMMSVVLLVLFVLSLQLFLGSVSVLTLRFSALFYFTNNTF